MGTKVFLVPLLLLELKVEVEWLVVEPVKNKSLGGLKEGNLALERFLLANCANVELESKTFLDVDEVFGSVLTVTLFKTVLLSMTAKIQKKTYINLISEV